MNGSLEKGKRDLPWEDTRTRGCGTSAANSSHAGFESAPSYGESNQLTARSPNGGETGLGASEVAEWYK